MSSSQSSGDRPESTGVSRTAILEALRRADAPLTVQQLADALGLHSNTVRFHLARLSKDGRVQEGRVGPSGPGRPKLAYTAVEEPAPTTKPVAQHDSYQLLAQILAGYLATISDSPSQDAVAAGLEWGRHLTERPAPFSSISAEQAFDKVTTIMDTLGFETERGGGGDLPLLQVHHCPFRTVASQRPDVACSVHLGLMRGALTEMGAPLLATELKVSHSTAPCLALFQSIGPNAGGDKAVKQAPRPEIGNPETVKPPAGE